MAGAVIAAFILGGIVAVIVDRATSDTTGTLRATATVGEAPVATLPAAADSAREIRATIVQYPAGYETTAVENGPTFAFVDFGRVEVEVDGARTSYVPGSFFYREQGRLYTLRVLSDAQLSIVRLVPPGEASTDEVG